MPFLQPRNKKFKIYKVRNIYRRKIKHEIAENKFASTKFKEDKT